MMMSSSANGKAARPVTITYDLPRRFDPQAARGWFPD
jgi:hypothetical protein